ncbi:hypothetical protein [Salinadaptatus halalkaliphilus]|uniref:hypothetical protein n=1 Tax=Salinadaptatus halalkaliphilus TaxID=2419781 RepID=UPI0015806218|nr:hypothetical protein [Salinadaptatus halalkaliphilus]
MSNKQQQVDSEIHGNQLRNFLIDVLTGVFTLDLGEKAGIDPEDIFEVFVGG